MNKQKIILNTLRYVMSFIVLWAFFDKVFGLGFSTKVGDAWIKGGSPTFGFLSFATKGPFVNMFHSLAGIAAVDWLFMAGLLFIGLTLLFNKFIKLGCIAGILMFSFMYLSLLFPANNPIIDEHIMYILVLALIAFSSDQKTENLIKN